MKSEKVLSNVDDIGLLQRRFELITIAQYRDKDKIKNAAKSIDKIREKTGKKGFQQRKL